MPEVSLLFRVKEEGSIDAATRRMEQSLQRVQQTAVQTTRSLQSTASDNAHWSKAANQIDAYVAAQGKSERATRDMAASGARANLSFRELRQSVGALTLGLAAQQPAIAGVAFQFASLGRMVSTLPGVWKAAAVAIVAGGAVAVGYVARLEELRQRQVDVNRAIRDTDTAGLRGQLHSASKELEEVASADQTWIGFLKNLPPLLFQGITAYEKATEKVEAYRAGLTKALDVEEKLASSQFREQRGLQAIARAEAAAGRAQSAGTLTPATIDSLAAVEQANLSGMQAEAAGRLRIEARRKVDRARADWGLTTNPEVLAINRQLSRDLILLDEETAQKRDDIEQGRITRRRAQAQQEMAEQIAILQNGLARQQAVLNMQASAEAASRGAYRSMTLANMTEEGRARYGQAIEYGGISEDLASLRAQTKAREDILTTSQARQLTILEASRQRKEITEQAYNERVRVMDQELTMAKLQGLQQYQAALQSSLNKAVSDYARYTAEVQRMEKELQATKRDTADMLAEIRRAGMTEQQALADRERSLQEQLVVAERVSGEERIAILRKVQQAYKDIAIDARRSQKEQRDAAQSWATTTNAEPSNDWRVPPGQAHSPAYNQRWNQSVGAPTPAANALGSRAGTSAPAFMNTGAPAYMDSTAALPFGMTYDEVDQNRRLRESMEKVSQIGEKIVQAQAGQKTDAQNAANASRDAADKFSKASQDAADAARRTAEGDQQVAERMSQAAEQIGQAGQTMAAAADKISNSVDGLASQLGSLAEAQNRRTYLDASQEKSIREQADRISRDLGLPIPTRDTLQGAIDDIVNEIRGSGGWGGDYVDPTGNWDPGYISPRERTRIYDDVWGGDTPSDAYDSGGIVPGPRGAARPSILHGGEVVANAEQQANILEALMNGRGRIPGGGGQPQTIIVQLDGKTIMEAQLPHLNQAAANGKVRFLGGR